MTVTQTITDTMTLDQKLASTGFVPGMIGQVVRIDVTNPNDITESLITYGKLNAIMIGLEGDSALVAVDLGVPDSEMDCPWDHIRIRLVGGEL